jgi:micrococcal nuclease
LPHYSRRRFRRRPYRALAAVVVIVGLLVARFLAGPQPPHPGQPLAEGPYHIRRVVDGDTIIVEPESTVRLIGVNTPETVKPEHPVEPWGPEAAEFTREFLARGTARLSFDRERVDRYGRFLAYVWVDDRMLNEELVRRGLARYEPQYRYSETVKRRFRQAQQEAQREHLGIWSDDDQQP